MNQEKPLTASQKLGIALLWLYRFAFALFVWFRKFRTAGKNFYNLDAAWGLLSQFVIVALIDEKDGRPAVYSTAATAGLLLLHRLAGSGDPKTTPSSYGGDSRFGDDWRSAKGQYEVIAGLAVAGLAFLVSNGLGTFYLLAVIGLGASYSYSAAKLDAELTAANDSRVQGQIFREQFEEEYR